MFKATINKIAAAPKNISQKAVKSVTSKFETVKTNVTTFGTDAVNNVLSVGETAAWKIADALHDRQIKPTS